MVQPCVIELHLGKGPTHRARNAMEQLYGRVADADDAQSRELRQGLSDQAGRIGEVDEPGAWRDAFHRARLRKGHWNCAERHGGASRPGGFLARETVFDGDALIARPGGDASHADAAENKFGSLGGLLQTRR